MSKSKRQELPVLSQDSGGLWMVATPIGNLQDLSPRARSTLAEAGLVLAEDTRVARSLFQALGLETKGKAFERCDRFREESSSGLASWVEAARSGVRIAYVSDAGTPGISDPGSALARRFRKEGLSITVVPGPSAVTAFLSGAGFASTHFAFNGFFPREGAEKRATIHEFFSSASRDLGIRIWFEAPSRIEETLEEWERFASAKADVGPTIRMVVAKELSKLHECWLFGNPGAVLRDFRARVAQDPRFASGEWVLGVEVLADRDQAPDEALPEAGDFTQELMKKILDFAAELPVKSSELAKAVSQAFGMDREVAYRALLSRRKKDS